MNWPGGGGGDEHFGNLMRQKADDVCRLAFLNVDTFPALASDPKNGTTRPPLKSGRLLYGDEQDHQRSHETQEASMGGAQPYWQEES
jgi:hypothetical protein